MIQYGMVWFLRDFTLNNKLINFLFCESIFLKCRISPKCILWGVSDWHLKVRLALTESKSFHWSPNFCLAVTINSHFNSLRNSFSLKYPVKSGENMVLCHIHYSDNHPLLLVPFWTNRIPILKRKKWEFSFFSFWARVQNLFGDFLIGMVDTKKSTTFCIFALFLIWRLKCSFDFP